MENEFREMKRKEEKQMADKMFEKNKMTKEVNDLKRAIINLEKQNIDLENLISECAEYFCTKLEEPETRF